MTKIYESIINGLQEAIEDAGCVKYQVFDRDSFNPAPNLEHFPDTKLPIDLVPQKLYDKGDKNYQ